MVWIPACAGMTKKNKNVFRNSKHPNNLAILKSMPIPSQVISVLEKLKTAGFDAYPVGGCARDFLLGREPEDWDVATNAKPEEIQKTFPKSFYENKFGTVTVLPDKMEIQITTYRVDEKYSDKRHPDSVIFTASLKEDLARRDFTINAMALEISCHPERSEGSRDSSLIAQNDRYKIIDPFNGQEDLKNKVIRAVGDPKQRFSEDALRLLRAVRFASQLNFLINKETLEAIKEMNKEISFISGERIRDEFIKIIMSDRAAEGVELLRETGILSIILPEVMEGYGIGQNKHHIYTVYEHNLRALRYTAENKLSLAVRLASLFHYVGKPRSKRGEGPDSTFYSHDVIGAKMTEKIMRRLKFPNEEIAKVSLLVRYHLFYYNVDEVTPSSVRRLIKNVGLENMDDLINVRIADRIGSGVPKAEPYKLRHFRYMADKVSKDPISVKMLKINGNDVMNILSIQPGPKVGLILNALFSEVLDDPKLNEREYLEKRALELNKLSIIEIAEMIKKGEERIQLLESEERKKFRV